ncbi:hypothetical protein [Streptacidiphilus carbonis]|jgi:hypothetical protein|uniref:hypothetical protein n=1 Tax=Streptacidiphilus carbonis TaxID=105422 RepID=UPI0005A95786|nr:hypothetical protein [Streptacidiphilus carbonis]
MGGWLWLLIPAVIVGGGRLGELLQGSLRTRHERRLELLKATEQRQLALDAANRPPEPVCGCTHHLAKHDRSGKCHEVVEAPTAWDAARKPLKYEARPCNCQQYIGPEPLGMVFAQDIVDPANKQK